MLGATLPLVSVVPFLALLVTIAVLPLVAHHWWHQDRNKGLVAALVSIPILAYFIFGLGAAGHHVLVEKGFEYAGFIAVIGALFVITGGIWVQGSFAGTPLVNTGMLGAGAILANLVGTTGASVLLIRPLLRANRRRKHVAHIVIFFIFIVSNCGGLLTAIGDPPLLLGFLRGVPFEWTLHLWPEWLALNGALLVIFNFMDQWAFDREEQEEAGSLLEEVLEHAPLRLKGTVPMLALLGVLATIIIAGRAGAAGRPWNTGVQEIIIVLIALVGYFAAPKLHRRKNDFTWAPLIEVAVLFAAIFVTMAPVLEILNAWSSGQRTILGMSFALHKPWHFFWATGALSSVLDNAPTYLAFAAAAAGLAGIPPHGPFIGELVAHEGGSMLLAALSTGAVFMGSLTYIGNAPNFMIRAIAQENGVQMPSFFGYMAYSVGILVPLFVVVSVVFFR
jgi:Na+/H+ antiporter NhaD/arsenite permease-like protein